MADADLIPNLAGKTLGFHEFWRPDSVAAGWATAAVLLLLLTWKLLLASISRRRQVRPPDLRSNPIHSPLLNPSSSTRTPEIISDADLRELMEELDEKTQEARAKWEDVIDKTNGLISYKAKCCRPKDGPLKYLSVTVFEKCSTELLRDFYMDNEYRREWDKTLIEYKQLEVDEYSGTEIGCMIKKFPLLTPREYVLTWRVWEGEEKTFYCITKDCEHPSVPRQKKYVRVGFFRSGWRIRKVPGRNACEVTVVHQEDAGLNVEMAKIVFARGIWNYVCKMNGALREYSPRTRSRSASVATMLRLIKKVPPALEIEARTASQPLSESSTPFDSQAADSITSERKLWSSPSKKLLLANGLLLLGGIACLSRGRTALGTQLAMACILKKLMKRGPGSDAGESEPARILRTRPEPRHRDRPWHLKL